MSENLKKIHESVFTLVYFRKKTESTEQFLNTLNNRLKCVKGILKDPKFDEIVDSKDKLCKKYLAGSLYTLQKLAVATNNDSVESLISIQQQENIKNLLQIMFSYGIAPMLVDGANVPLIKISNHLKLYIPNDMTALERHNLLSTVIHKLLELLKCSKLRSIVLCHLRDLLSFLLQIIFYRKIKKPSTDTNSTMSIEEYERLILDQSELKTAYNELIDGIYKPLVIKELLVLLMPDKGKGTTAPRWLERAIIQQLTDYLVSPGGVIMLMRACFPTSSENVEWAIVMTMSRLITGAHLNMDPEKFYSCISPQILSLLNATGTYCIPVAKMCIKMILQKKPDLCNRFIFNKLFEPFIICSKPICKQFSGTLINEELLGRCIENINKCYGPGSEQSAIPFSTLTKIIKILFVLYLKIVGSPFQHQNAVQDILIQYLYAETDTNKLKDIYSALLFNEPYSEMLEMRKELSFEFGSSGGIQIVKNNTDNDSERPLSWNMNDTHKLEFACSSIVKLLHLNESYSKKLIHDFFVVFLNLLISICSEADIVVSPVYLDPHRVFYYFMVKNEKKMCILKTLADLSENPIIAQSILESIDLIVSLAVLLLENCSRAIDVDKNDIDEELAQITIPLSIIDIITNDLKPSSEKWEVFQPMLDPLKLLKTKCPSKPMRIVCEEVYEKLLSRGAVKGKKIYPKTNHRRDCDRSNRSETNTLGHIFSIVFQKDAPTKGYGLILLQAKIKGRDEETIRRKEEIFTVLKVALADPDTYVYLAAINALESMAYINVDMAIEFLCIGYMTNKHESSDFQLKIGEVLMRITRSLSDVGPNNKNMLINTFLHGAKSQDNFLRASCLSNLGEVLKKFGHSSKGVIHEVFGCIQSISSDDSEMVRRSAVLLAELLIKGCAEIGLTNIEDIIKDLYKLLVILYQNDKDDAVKTIAENAIIALNEQLKDELFKLKPLEKQISILKLKR